MSKKASIELVSRHGDHEMTEIKKEHLSISDLLNRLDILVISF